MTSILDQKEEKRLRQVTTKKYSKDKNKLQQNKKTFTGIGKIPLCLKNNDFIFLASSTNAHINKRISIFTSISF